MGGIIVKTKRIRRAMLLLALGCLPIAYACGGIGGTETGSVAPPINISALAAHVEEVADTLVPEVSDAGGASLIAMQALTFGTSDQWDQYLQDSNLTVLTDVFGEGDASGVVTRIRVLTNQFRDTLEGIFSQDPDISCEGADVLEEGDTLEVAFYGAISNGTAEDRYFDCAHTQTHDDPQDNYTTLYGEDSSGGVVRIVSMMDVTNANEWWPEERGNLLRNLQVVYATYAETEEEGGTVGYLDLQYAQASIYSGLDDDLGAEDDNILFKSRTRITGRATLDESGVSTGGVGDFTVTKYDRSINDDATVWTSVTKTVGRGDYSSEGFSLFGIDSTSMDGAAGTFCIQTPVEGAGLPAHAEDANCSAYETTTAWGSAEFPFALADEIELNFEDKVFFEGTDTDLISNSGDNFAIPTYESTSPADDSSLL